MMFDSPRPLDLQQSRNVDIIGFHMKPVPEREIKKKQINCESDSRFCLNSSAH
jgi:hypothetical protein